MIVHYGVHLISTTRMKIDQADRQRLVRSVRVIMSLRTTFLHEAALDDRDPQAGMVSENDFGSFRMRDIRSRAWSLIGQ
jgi:hypothetical protein